MTFSSEIHTFHSGRPQPESSSKTNTFVSVDPSNAKPLATIYTTTPEQLNSAIAAAQAAFPTWSQTPAPRRAAILLKAAAILRERNDELALTETLDTGKPWSETSTVDVATGADVLEYYAHIAAGSFPGQNTRLRADAFVLTTHEPLGVCAGIGAWNYPIQIALWKSAPCLAAGNCMVYKPSEVTPLHAQTLAQIYIEAGVPPGVFNVVYGDGIAVGAPLVAHSNIAKVSFTGQVSTGSKVASQAVKDMKGVTMELGGKSPLVILPNADIEEAADTAMVANFFSTGQVCTNGTRVFVPDTLLSQVEQAIVQRCREGIRMGLPQNGETNFGPMVSAAQQEKVKMYIQHGRTVDKAKVLFDGSEEPSMAQPTSDGFWVHPVVFTNCTDNMRVVKEEIFGPVMCIMPYSTQGRTQQEWVCQSLIARANIPPGSCCWCWSSDVGLAHEVVQKNSTLELLGSNTTWGSHQLRCCQAAGKERNRMENGPRGE
ncbi:NAD/NADP-dependent betaine aldehyde dehydrogenase [Fusarium oxysporum f. sp. conglutinans]|nr:NAD/NADP-dependent betaine aldehyde dehydrogenase [Fusarium oxysporum f. sp. conglutinans]